MPRPRHPNKEIEQAVAYAESKGWRYSFVLVLSGIADPTDELANALYESGCDDASLVFRTGVPLLFFDREAESLVDAIMTAISDVEKSDIGIQVIEVQPPDEGAIDAVNGLLQLMRKGSRGAREAWKALKNQSQGVSKKPHRKK